MNLLFCEIMCREGGGGDIIQGFSGETPQHLTFDGYNISSQCAAIF